MKTEYIVGIVVVLAILIPMIYKSFNKKPEEVDIYDEETSDEKEWDAPEEVIEEEKPESVLNPSQKVYLYSVGKNKDDLIETFDSLSKCSRAMGISRHKVKALAKSEKRLEGTSVESYLSFVEK